MTLPIALAHLEAAGLIQLFAAQPELEYIFRHALVRDAAYGSLLHRQRRALHQAAGEALEANADAGPLGAGLAPLLGHHFDEAGDAVRALRYYTLAGEAAAAQYALPEAIGFFDRALVLARGQSGLDAATLMALYRQRGRALQSIGQWDLTWRNYLELEDEAQARGAPALRLAGLIERATLRAVFGPMFDPAASVSLSHQALALAEQLHDRAARARILWNMMRATSYDDVDGGLAIGEQALTLARQAGDTRQLAFTLHDLHYTFRAAGQFDRALDVLAEARALFRQLGDQHMLADNLNQTAMLLLPMGELDQVVTLTEEADTVSVGSRNDGQHNLSHLMAGSAYLDRGRPDLALAKLQAAWATVVSPWSYGIVAQGLAEVWASLGNLEEALTTLQTNSAHTRQVPLWTLLGRGLLGQQALVEIALGRLKAAAATVAEAKALTGAGMQFGALTLDRSEKLFIADVQLALARHDPAAALALCAESLPTMRRLSLRRPLPEMLSLQAAALEAAGQPEAAYHSLLEARAVATAIGQRRTLWSILARLAAYEAARGEPEASSRLRAEAAAIVTAFAQHAGSAALSESFLSLPSVQAVLHST
jgi:tetratricopeptide (TPR) repeat protein